MAALLLDTELDSEQREFARAIQSCGDSLMVILNDVLDLSKIEAGKIEIESIPFDLQTVAENVLEILGPAARTKGVDLLLDCPDEAAHNLCGDPTRIRQVLTNLVGNAVKFTPAGRVAVRVRAEPRGEDRCAVTVSVEDSGIGIPAEKLDRLFEQFSQVDASTTRCFGGTGLGLAISERLLERMGGSIEVESTVGQGSTFRCRLELLRDQTPPATLSSTPVTSSARPPDPLPPPGAARRVLLVDDNRVNATIAEHMLRKLGCRIDRAENGQEALDRLDQGSYDLVLMDVQMPVMDGYEATRGIRAREGSIRHTPIIALTANVMTRDQERCAEAGMDDHLAKPIRFEQMRDIVDRWAPPRRSDT